MPKLIFLSLFEMSVDIFVPDFGLGISVFVYIFFTVALFSPPKVFFLKSICWGLVLAIGLVLVHFWEGSTELITGVFFSMVIFSPKVLFFLSLLSPNGVN